MKRHKNRQPPSPNRNRASAKSKSDQPPATLAVPTAGAAPHAPVAILFDGKRRWLIAIALAVAVLVIYAPALNGQFVWDDDSWTSVIHGLLRDFAGLKRIWFDPTAMQQYYPLTGTTFWLDYHLWGFRTLPYHIENALLHACGAFLFGLLLRRLNVRGAWLAASLFAVHPVMVESVAWITERKNALSLVLYLAAILAYGRFTNFWKTEDATDTPVSATRRNSQRLFYALALLLFPAAYLAKATVFALPAVLLLICWWKRGTIRLREDLLPTLPFFAVTLGLGFVTSSLEKHHVGAEGAEWAIPFLDRCLVAGRAIWFYVGKLVFPANLCFVYPRWQPDTRAWQHWIFPILVVAVVGALWLARTRFGRGPIAAALYFIGTLFPVLGFMNAYFMRYSFVCDHWVYLSSLGIFAAAASFLVSAAERGRVPRAVYAVAAIVLPALALLTWRQAATYADMNTLWQSTLATNPDAALAHNNLGVTLLHAGKTGEAIDHFQRAIRSHPNAEEYNNLGEGLLQNGQADEAKTQFRAALALEPRDPIANNNLGAAFLQSGRQDEAIPCFRRALELKPDYAEAHNNLALCLLQKGQVDDAIAHWKRAVELDPHYKVAADNLARVAWVLATCPEASMRNGSKAVALSEELDRLAGGADAMIARTLAAAYAENGQFTAAVSTAERALRLSPKTNSAEEDALRQQLELYRKGIPFHDNGSR